jgi:hypothetical protein
MRLFALATTTGLILLASAAAQSAPPADTLQVATERAWQAAIKAHDSPQACSTSIGLQAAKAIVRYCLYMSGATHPPCNSINACSVITDHVGFQVRAAPGEVIPGESTLHAADWKTIATMRAQ